MQQKARIPPENLSVRALAAVFDVVVVFGAFYLAASEWGKPLSSGGKGWEGNDALFVFALMLCYWLLSEWALGFTLGKLVFGLRVVSLSGDDITFLQSLKRNLLRFFDAVGFYLTAFLVARSNPNRQRLGDLWAGTIVVSTEALNKFKNSLKEEAESA